jgi:uncharacterized protein YbaP (TraB family)
MPERSSKRPASISSIAVLLLAFAACTQWPDATLQSASTTAAAAPQAAEARPDRCPTSLATTRPEIPSREARPPFFRVEGEGGATLFLFGTVHTGPPEGWILSTPARDALSGADTIVLEVDPREASEEHVSTLVANMALLEPGIRLADRIEPETLALLDARSAELNGIGFPSPIRSLMKPWFLAVGIGESLTRQTGLVPAAAMDEQIFDALGERELIALETVRQQLDLFDQLSPSLQDLILRDALLHYDESARSLETLVRAWQVGDEEQLACLAREGVDALPELEAFYTMLIDDRNRAWQAKLERILASPARRGDRVFVAVGAMHLVGKPGLPALLREAGYRVERVDQSEEQP